MSAAGGVQGEVEIVKVKVDPDECTGCALCVDTCPDVFEMVGDLVATKVKYRPEQKRLAFRLLRIILLRRSE